MFDDLAAYFCDNVVASFGDYLRARDRGTSGRSRHLRAAVQAASALFHFREHYSSFAPLSRREVTAKCADFRLIADVANVSKHKSISRVTSDGPPLVTKAEKIDEVATITAFRDEKGRYTHQQSVVIVQCDDGTPRNLDLALTNVFNFWVETLRQDDVYRYPLQQIPPEPGSQYISRANATASAFEASNKLRWRQNMQLLEFDEAKGVASPIDLSGHDLRLVIYKPSPKILDVDFQLPGEERVRSFEWELTEEEFEIYQTVKDEEGRAAFIQELARRRPQELEKRMSEAFGEEVKLVRRQSSPK